MPGSFALTTFGCQMNTSDSERIRSILVAAGLQETRDHDSAADVMIYNTCSVRQTAEDRIYGMAKRLAELKKIKPATIVVITGCMAGRDKDGNIRNRLAMADLFFSIEEIIYLPQRISQLNPDLIDPAVASSFEYEHYLRIQPRYRTFASAYIAISTGCNKFCTYCVVPYSRGRAKDRQLKEILDEVHHLSLNGCKEITLLGQTVNLYNPSDKNHFKNANPFDRSKNCFAALLWELNQIPGILRIHFTAPHPQYADDQMLAALSLPKQINYLHMPVQSGSNAILKRMNRPYTREYYIERISKVREKNPLISLGTDIIVGFCGETQKDFEQTIDLYQTCDFDISYTAMYSVRSGTVAANMYKDDVPKSEKKRRWQELQSLMESIVFQKNQAYVGKCVEVLVDSCDRGQCGGNSREMKRVSFRGTHDLVGAICFVKIDRALEWVMYGHREDTAESKV